MDGRCAFCVSGDEKKDIPAEKNTDKKDVEATKNHTTSGVETPCSSPASTTNYVLETKYTLEERNGTAGDSEAMILFPYTLPRHFFWKGVRLENDALS